jgi:cytochrome c-type biogenesis protein
MRPSGSLPYRRAALNRGSNKERRQLEFSLPLVIGAGVLSFLSPCVLPLVPPYLTYMSGASYDQLRAEAVSGSPGRLTGRVALTSIFFILGFSVVFITLGATATAFGQVFRQLLPILTPIAGVVIIAMGLHFLGVFRIGLLDRQLRHNGPGAASGPVGGFLLGLAFAIGWTPCIGPVLAAILSVAASRDTAMEGATLLGLYSLGLGIPFFLAGIAIGPFLTFFNGFKRHLGTVEKIMGAFLVVTGILFITGNFTRISYWFLETFPVLANFG